MQRIKSQPNKSDSKTHPAIIILHALALCTIALYAFSCNVVWAGEYYKWVDENGVSHFSERPPRGATEITEKLKTSVRASGHEDEASQSPEESQATENPTEPTVSLKDKKRCQAEKDRLKALSSGARIRMKGADGSDHYLDEQQIQEQARISRQAIQESC